MLTRINLGEATPPLGISWADMEIEACVFRCGQRTRICAMLTQASTSGAPVAKLARATMPLAAERVLAHFRRRRGANVIRARRRRTNTPHENRR
jgi:hypothetical protein